MGNPVCLWQTELFKLNLKSSPSSSGYNRRRQLATRSSGKQQAERTAVRATLIVCPEESPSAPTGAYPCPRWGLTRRLRRERMGLPPRRGIVLSFDAKESTKESMRHGNSCGPPRCASRASVCGSPFGAVLDLGSLRSPFWGKSPLLPILTAGLAMSRAAELDRLRLLSCALGARLFPPSKWAGLFPSAAYRRSAPAQSA